MTGLPLDAQVQRKRLGVVMCVVAVQCSCVVVHHANPSPTVHPCAPDAAPPRYPTHAGKKRCASGLLGPLGAKGASMGERRRLPDGVGLNLAVPLPLLYRRIVGGSISNPKPCLTRVQPELGFQPLKLATLWVHVHIDMGQVLLLAQ